MGGRGVRVRDDGPDRGPEVGVGNVGWQKEDCRIIAVMVKGSVGRSMRS